MSLYDRSVYDQYEAEATILRRCRGCGARRPLEDGYCPRCNGEDMGEGLVLEANRRAGERAREEQRKRGRLAFLEEWHR